MPVPATPRIGFIGTGHIATFHSKMLRRCGVPHERGAVFDIDPARAETFAAASGSTVVGSEQEVVDYVLHPPRAEEQAAIDDAIAKSLAVWPLLADGKTEAAMLKLHTKEKKPNEP